MGDFKGRLKQKELFNVLQIPSSSAYYKNSETPRGIKPSEFTLRTDGASISNNEVIHTLIQEVLSVEFNRYGYRMCNEELKALGFHINHKKTYRLMKEKGLLLQKVGINRIKREWVKYRKIEGKQPYEHLCMDIKYIHIHGIKRNAYLPAIMDISTRYVLAWSLKFTMKHTDVILSLFNALQGYEKTSQEQEQRQTVMLRTDNGSQFISNGLAKYCKSEDINHEFTHVATPEENSYVESLFSCVEKEVVLAYEFDSIHHAREVFNRYFLFHNTKRRRHALGRKCPAEYWNNVFSSCNHRPPKSERWSFVKGGETTCLALDKVGI